MNPKLTLIALLGLSLAISNQALGRKWKDLTGKYEVDAEFVDLKDDVLRLRKTDGKVISIPLAKMSVPDQGFAKKQVTVKPDSPVVDGVKIGREIRRFEGHTDEAIHGLTFTPNGQHIISAGGDKVLRMWDVVTGDEVRVFRGHEDRVGCVAISADGSRMISGSWDITMRIWDVESGKQIRVLRSHKWPVLTVAISSDGKIALSGSDGFRLWDLETGKVRWHNRQHSLTVWSVAFSPDEKQCLTGSWDKTVRLWDTTNSRERRRLNHHGQVKCVRFSPDGRYAAAVATIGNNTIGVWELETFEQQPGFEGHLNGIGWLAFSEDGTKIASTSGQQILQTGNYDNKATDRSVRVWDAKTGRELVRFNGHKGYVSGVAFSPNGKLLASTAMDGTVRLWELP